MATMNFTPEQLTGLNAAYTRQQQNQATSEDLENLKYATSRGFAPASQMNQPPVSDTSPVTSSTMGVTTEAKPGVFSASKLMDFYNNRIDTMKPQADLAQQNLSDISSQLATLQRPDYGSEYQQAYQANVAPVEAQINTVSSKVTSIDDNLRKIEDDVRAEIGGRASEAIIQAEVAARSKPLLLERQTFVDQLNNLNTQRESQIAQAKQNLQFTQQSFQEQLGLLSAQKDLAQETLTNYNTLVEKGAAATDKEIDNFRQMFNTLLTQAPDVLRTATQEEIDYLRSGYVPESLMKKIGDTIAEQKLTTSPKIFGTASSGYYTLDEYGNPQQLVAPSVSAGGLSEYQKVSLAQKLYDADPSLGSIEEAMAKVEQIYGSPAGQIAAAIKQVESGGNYQAQGASGEGGAYQFMPSTWKQWAGDYLGDPNAEQTPENQDIVAISHINKLMSQGYTPEQIALIWNGGQPIVKKGVNKYGVAYDSGAYAKKVLAALGAQTGGLRMEQQGTADMQGLKVAPGPLSSIFGSGLRLETGGTQEPQKITTTQPAYQPYTSTFDIDKFIDNAFAASSKSNKTEMKRGLYNVLNTQGPEAVKMQIDNIAYNRLSATEKDTYDMNDRAKESYQVAKDILDSSDLQAGPYKQLFESKKPWALIETDPKYNMFKVFTDIGTAELKRAFFGTAVTQSEQNTAAGFLINETDDMGRIMAKLTYLPLILQFANDAKLAKTQGTRAPKLNEYIDVSRALQEVQNPSVKSVNSTTYYRDKYGY